MASYDSDSSDGEDNYTSTNVLLGYASQEPTDDAISHLGGHPTWIDGKTAPPGDLAKCKVCNGLLTLLLELNGTLPERFPDHERRLYIFSCKRKACRRKDGSVRGVRGVKVLKAPPTTAKQSQQKESPSGPAPGEKPPQPQPLLGESLFGVKPSAQSSESAKQNPFSTNPPAAQSTAPRKTGTWSNPFDPKYVTEETNPFEAPATHPAVESPISPGSTAISPPATPSLAETLASTSISSPKLPPSAPRPQIPWPAESEFPSPYPRYHLDAEYETLDSGPAEIPQNTRLVEEGADFGEGASGGGGGAEDKEVFESTLDKAFQKFADRLAQNPEQVLRYEFGGQPLLYSRDDAVGRLLAASGPAVAAETKVQIKGHGVAPGFPRCGNCGAPRVFEVQLTPHAITELEAEEIGLEGMDWGTVIMAVCEKDCVPRDVGVGEVGYVEEWVGVQWEEVRKPGK